MECSAHSDTVATTTCSLCSTSMCTRCLTYEVDGVHACEPCGISHAERSQSMGSTLLVLVAVGYLATLAVGYLLFRARPFIGGFAAVTAIALGRMIQLHFRPRHVTRRSAPTDIHPTAIER